MTTADSSPPPYMPFPTFETTLDKLVDRPPSHVHRDMLKNFSGSTQSQVLSGLRYLGLIKESKADEVTPALLELLEARREGGDAYKDRLKQLLSEAYGDIVADVDLHRGTLAQLKAAFEGANVPQGQMLTKTIRFFVKAHEAAGTDISPYMKAKGGGSSTSSSPRVTRRSNKGKKKAASAPPVPATSTTDGGGRRISSQKPPQGFAVQEIPTMEGALIQYPLTMTKEQAALFDAALTFIKAVTQKGG